MAKLISRLILILALALISSMTVTAQDSVNILTWVEDGPSPSESSPSAVGELGLIDEDGTFTPLLEVPAQTSRLRACGDKANSPDGTAFAFYVGLDFGTLYLMQGTDTPDSLDDVHALTCAGNGTLRYSPDGSRLGYIAYENDAAASEFADGFLHIMSMTDLSEEALFENAVAFDLNDDGAGFISFFTNDRNEADEAAIFWWNGNAEREVATLRPDENCRYTSASLSILPSDNLMAVLGHRCTSGDTRTSWQLYSIDVTDRSAALVASDFQAGQFASFARTNNILILPDGETALFTVPDGITANTVGVMGVNLEDFSTFEVVERQAVFPNLAGTRNAAPLLSPDGGWLALVVTSPNNENTLNVFDLSAPDLPPISISAGSTNDVISDMAFSADSQQLIFIAGSPDTGRTADNSLIALDLSSGNDFRIKRGRFAPGIVVAPDGSSVVAMDFEVVEDERQPPFLNLVSINIETSETVLLFEGADIVDGEVTNRRFAMPISWRP